MRMRVKAHIFAARVISQAKIILDFIAVQQGQISSKIAVAISTLVDGDVMGLCGPMPGPLTFTFKHRSRF